MSLQGSFVKVLSEYEAARNAGYAAHPLGAFVRQTLAAELENAAHIVAPLMVKGSVGITNWADVPWLMVCDSEITKSARQGYYCVYLFDAELRGVYLSLAVAYEQFKDEYGAADGKKHLEHIVSVCRAALKSRHGDFGLDPINLRSGGDLPRGYELGTICSKYYPADEIPSDAVLANDLRNLIGVYRELKGYVGVGGDIKKFSGSYFGVEPGGAMEICDVDAPEDSNLQPSPRDSEPRPPVPRIGRKGGWPRDPRRAKRAIEDANYSCEVEKLHLTFESHKTGKAFMEAHHLVSMRMQEHYNVSLDVTPNIISVCPTCHRRLHYGKKDELRKVISALYEKRAKALAQVGITCDLAGALQIYGISS